MKISVTLTLIILWCSFVLAFFVFAKGVDKNTMAIWMFDETKGDTVEDLSGRGHNLKVEGSHKWVAGKFGNALYFTQSAFVEYKSHPDLSFEDGMTIEFWLNLEDITPQNVVGIPRKESEYVVAAYEQGNGFYMGPWINNGAWVGPLKSTVVSPYGEWHHHAVTYDGKELKVYVDGKSTGSMKIAGPMNKTDAPFRISNSCCGGRFFVGALDEMRISNIPRTEAEIKELLERGLASILAVEAANGLSITWGRIKSGN
ncbi:MAG: LamG domain-containing protein [Candidatus Poribacteria bacterium]